MQTWQSGARPWLQSPLLQLWKEASTLDNTPASAPSRLLSDCKGFSNRGVRRNKDSVATILAQCRDAKWLLKLLGLLGHPAVGEAKKATFPVADKLVYRCDRQTQFRNFEDMFSLTSFSKKKPQLALADADHITQHFALEHWRQTGSSATALYYAALVPLADTDARYDSDSDLFRLTQDVLAAPSLSRSPALALAVDAAGFQFQITEDETAGLTRSGAAQVAIVREDGLSRCTLFRVNHWYPSRMKQVQGNFQASLCAKDVAVSLYAIAELDSDTQVLRTTGVPEGCRAELSSSSGSLVFFVSLLCRLFAHKFQIRLC